MRPAGGRCRAGLLAIGLTLAIGASAAEPAHAQVWCILGGCEPSSPPPSSDEPEPPACSQIGTVDRNPSNSRIAPVLGRRLAPRRGDGQLHLGFSGVAAFNYRATLADEIKIHRRAGSTMIRVPLHWGAAERTRGAPSFDSYDDLYCRLLAGGIRPVFSILTTPRWAKDASAYCPWGTDSCFVPPAQAHLPSLRRFAELVAIRYPMAAAIEVWNEPNVDRYWDKPDPRRYLQVLASTYAGVKDGNPDMPVLGGALSAHEADRSDGTLAAMPFLEAVYAAGGRHHMDAISLHPYPRLPQSRGGDRYDALINATRSIASTYDGPGRHLWLTEIGAPVKTGEMEHGFTESGQADALVSIYDRATASVDVDAIFFHSLIDMPDSSPYGFVKRRDWLGRYYGRQVYCRFAYRLGQRYDCSNPIPLG